MMFSWVYRLSDYEFLYGGPCEQIYSTDTHGLVILQRHPRPRTERYDGNGGIRVATAQEIASYDAALISGQALERFDNEKFVKALAIWAAAKLNIQMTTARTEILNIYKSL